MSQRSGSLGSATAHVPKGRGLMLTTAHQKLPITSCGSKAGHAKARVSRIEAAQSRLRPFADATAALNASKEADQIDLGADEEDFDDLDDDEAVNHDDYRNHQGEHWSSPPSSPYRQALSDDVLDLGEDEDADEDDAHLDPRLRATSQLFRVETRGPAQPRQKAAQPLRSTKANPSIASIAELAGSDAFLERLSSQVAEKVLKVLQPTMSKMATEPLSSDTSKVSAAPVNMVPEHAAAVKRLIESPQSLTAADFTRKTGEQVDEGVLWTSTEARTALAQSKGIDVLPNNTELPLTFALRDAQGKPVDDKRVDAIQGLVRNIVDDILLPLKVMDDQTRLDAQVANGHLWTAWRNRIPEYNLTYFNKYHKAAVLEVTHLAEATVKELQYCHGHYKAVLVIKRRLRNVAAKGKDKSKSKKEDEDEDQEDIQGRSRPTQTQQPLSVTPTPHDTTALKKRSRGKTSKKDKADGAATAEQAGQDSAKRRKSAGKKASSANVGTGAASADSNAQEAQPQASTNAYREHTVPLQVQTPGAVTAANGSSGITPIFLGATMSEGHHNGTSRTVERNQDTNPYRSTGNSQVPWYSQQLRPQRSGSPTPGVDHRQLRHQMEDSQHAICRIAAAALSGDPSPAPPASTHPFKQSTTLSAARAAGHVGQPALHSDAPASSGLNVYRWDRISALMPRDASLNSVSTPAVSDLLVSTQTPNLELLFSVFDLLFFLPLDCAPRPPPLIRAPAMPPCHSAIAASDQVAGARYSGWGRGVGRGRAWAVGK
ncbi:hypothetical protein V8E36_007061 [Tilletia maclaganii]